MSLPLLTDSYKISHWNQYPDNTEYVYAYCGARGDSRDEVVFFGLQYYLHDLSKGFRESDIDVASAVTEDHFGAPDVFNEEGWRRLLHKHNGMLPLEIKAVPEGMVLPAGLPMFTVVNTDKEFPWLTSYVETHLMKVWYPCTVATKAHRIRKLIEGYWRETNGATNGASFAYHNFGDRGSSSAESAAIGGVAHLTSFMGTDNLTSLMTAALIYSEPCAGYSIPATEHSTVTSWGQENEFAMYDAFLERNKNAPMIACVLDSYDILKATDYITSGQRKEKIESSVYPKFILRPDSGDPVGVIGHMISTMESNDVKFTVNSKGYREWEKYGIIWGDGINAAQIRNILESMKRRGYAASNIAFGSGGDLMQNCTRDTHRFSMKTSAIYVDGTWRDVYKSPVTAPDKASLKGRVETVKLNGWSDKQALGYAAIDVNDAYNDISFEPLMKTVFRNGTLTERYTLSDVRQRLNA